MAQWKNLNRYSSFVNPPRLPFFCEISGALLLALPGLTAGKQASWQAGCQTKSVSIYKFLKFATDQNIYVFVAFSRDTAFLQHYQCIQVGFSAKVVFKVGCRSAKFWEAINFLGDPYY